MNEEIIIKEAGMNGEIKKKVTCFMPFLYK